MSEGTLLAKGLFSVLNRFFKESAEDILAPFRGLNAGGRDLALAGVGDIGRVSREADGKSFNVLMASDREFQKARQKFLKEHGRLPTNEELEKKGIKRPYIRKNTKRGIEEQRDSKGRLIDPNTGKPIKGKPDVGHKPGYEWRDFEKEALKKGLSQKQINELAQNAKAYRLEDLRSNRSHKFEDRSKAASKWLKGVTKHSDGTGGPREHAAYRGYQHPRVRRHLERGMTMAIELPGWLAKLLNLMGIAGGVGWTNANEDMSGVAGDIHRSYGVAARPAAMAAKAHAQRAVSAVDGPTGDAMRASVDHPQGPINNLVDHHKGAMVMGFLLAGPVPMLLRTYKIAKLIDGGITAAEMASSAAVPGGEVAWPEELAAGRLAQNAIMNTAANALMGGTAV